MRLLRCMKSPSFFIRVRKNNSALHKENDRSAVIKRNKSLISIACFFEMHEAAIEQIL